MKKLILALAITLPVMAQTKTAATKTEPAKAPGAATVSISAEDSAAIWRMKATASDAKSRVDDLEKQAQTAIQQAQQQAAQVDRAVNQKFTEIAAKYGCSTSSFKPSADQTHPEKMTCEKAPAKK